MRINTNLAALTAQRNLGNTQRSVQRTVERLSSGLRVNNAKDDAAGLAAASIPIQLPWVPLLAPPAVLALYVLTTRPFWAA